MPARYPFERKRIQDKGCRQSLGLIRFPEEVVRYFVMGLLSLGFPSIKPTMVYFVFIIPSTTDQFTISTHLWHVSQTTCVNNLLCDFEIQTAHASFQVAEPIAGVV